MKIYRAVFQYNNCDYCEWERWYTKSSVWYSNREFAERHLDELNRFRDWLRDDYFKKYTDIDSFKYKDPYIETVEVKDKFVPFEIELSMDSVHNDNVNFK